MMNVKPCPLCKNRNSRLERVLNGIDLLKCQNCEFVYARMSDGEIERANSACFDEATSRYKEHQTVLDEVWFASIARRFTKSLSENLLMW